MNTYSLFHYNAVVIKNELCVSEYSGKPRCSQSCWLNVLLDVPYALQNFVVIINWHEPKTILFKQDWIMLYFA